MESTTLESNPSQTPTLDQDQQQKNHHQYVKIVNDLGYYINQIKQNCDCCLQEVCQYLYLERDIKTKINLNNNQKDRHLKQDIVFTYITHLVEQQKQGSYISLFQELSDQPSNKSITDMSNDKNLKIWQQGVYQDDLKNGFWVTYYDNGTKKSEGNFSNNRRQGLWTWYHNNNNIYSQGCYENDQLHGMWMFYDETGQLVKYGKYENGKKEGQWVYDNEKNTKTFYNKKNRKMQPKRQQKQQKEQVIDDEGFQLVTK